MKRPWRFIRRWGSLGNLVDGDCTVAAYYHILMALAVLDSSTFKRVLYRLGFRVPHTKFALKEYSTYLSTLNEKPSPETGVAPDGWLNYQKALGNVLDSYQWQPPSSLDEPTLRSWLDTFGGVLLFGCLTKFSYESSGRTWYLRPGDAPDPSIGHAVAYLDYNATVDRCVTWGHWQGMSITYRELCLNGACVFVHKSDPDAVAKLAAIKTLRGN